MQPAGILIGCSSPCTTVREGVRKEEERASTGKKNVQRILNTQIQRDFIFHLNLWMKETWRSGRCAERSFQAASSFFFCVQNEALFHPKGSRARGMLHDGAWHNFHYRLTHCDREHQHNVWNVQRSEAGGFISVIYHSEAWNEPLGCRCKQWNMSLKTAVIFLF